MIGNRLLATALLVMATGGAVSAQTDAPAVDRPTNEGAAATFFAAQVSRSVHELDSLGMKIDRERFIRLFVDAFGGKNVGFDSPEQAQGWIADALIPAAIPAADGAAETEWVSKQLALPRTEELPGGTVLQRLVEGSGSQPQLTDTVMVMYTGRLSSGSVFDSTETPFAMPVSNVVPGLRDALLRMRRGGTYRVFIPPAEAYGTRTIMDLIPANSALDFTIELSGE